MAEADDDSSRHPLVQLDAQKMRLKRPSGTLMGGSSPLKVTTSLKDRCFDAPKVNVAFWGVIRCEEAPRGLDCISLRYQVLALLQPALQIHLHAACFATHG